MTQNIFADELEAAKTTADGAHRTTIPMRRPRKAGPPRYRRIAVPAEPPVSKRPRASRDRGLQMVDEAKLVEVRGILDEHRAAQAHLDCRVRRATAASMAGVMLIATPPVGGAMLVLSSVREGSARLQAQLCALGGLLVSLQVSGLVPMV